MVAASHGPQRAGCRGAGPPDGPDPRRHPDSGGDQRRARITLIDEQRPTRGIADLYAQADVLVAVGNEGFGLPAVEAMAAGLPCILLDSEGQHDTIEDACPDRVLAVPAAAWQPADDTPYGPAGKRGVPDADDIADRLRWIATHRDQARHIGQRAADWALTERNIWTKGPRVLALAAGSTREATIDPDAYRDRLLHVTRGSYYYGSYWTSGEVPALGGHTQARVR